MVNELAIKANKIMLKALKIKPTVKISLLPNLSAKPPVG